MENTNNSSFINWMFWFSRIGFGAHLLLLIFTTWSMYFDYPNQKDSRFPVYGNFRLCKVESTSKDYKLSDSLYRKKDNSFDIHISPRMNLHKAVFWFKEMPDGYLAYLLTLVDLLCWWIWLLFTFQLMKIFTSLKKNSIFEKFNITRIRWIALIIGIVPFLKLIHHFLFADLVREHLSIPGYYVAFTYDYEILSGTLFMILIFVLSEIFKFGFKLQQENDLTI